MSVDTIVTKCISSVPKALAAGVVDMNTGMLLAIKTVESHPQAVMDLVAAGTKELFEGEIAQEIENSFKKIRGDSSSEHYFTEMLINSKNLIHFFGRVKSSPDTIMVVITRAEANLGLVVTKCRMIINSETV